MLNRLRINRFQILCIVVLCLSVLIIFGCSPQEKETSETSTEQPEKQETVIKPVEEVVEETKPEPKPMIDPENAIAVIETAKGNIEFEFYATDAPQTSKNFIKNATMGYYRNENFHSVEELFIQAGTSITSDTLPIEKSDHSLVKGVVLMAKEPGSDVSDADEFFICKDAIALDEDYTILGKVTKGIEILDSIEKYDKILNITIRERDTE